MSILQGKFFIFIAIGIVCFGIISLIAVNLFVDPHHFSVIPLVWMAKGLSKDTDSTEFVDKMCNEDMRVQETMSIIKCEANTDCISPLYKNMINWTEGHYGLDKGVISDFYLDTGGHSCIEGGFRIEITVRSSDVPKLKQVGFKLFDPTRDSFLE